VAIESATILLTDVVGARQSCRSDCRPTPLKRSAGGTSRCFGRPSLSPVAPKQLCFRS